MGRISWARPQFGRSRRAPFPIFLSFRMHEDGSGAMNFACAAFQIILSSDGMNDARETVNVLPFRALVRAVR